MSPAMLEEVKNIIPPLLSHFHKGQLGRVLVVGGSEDYTGAPYFAAMASALVGADMSHVLCTASAAPTIKSYSPNLMVHPYLHDEDVDKELNMKISSLLDRMHVVLIGPGLGRNPTVFSQIESIISLCSERKLPLIIDADGLFLVHNKPQIIEKYQHRTFLTPNVVEFKRLVGGAGKSGNPVEDAKVVARKLNSVLIVKGENDIITDGTVVAYGKEKGSNRRVSGQGDTLSGSLATFVAWASAYSNQLWDVKPVKNEHILACLGASSVTRRASKLAFEKRGRSMVTTDVNGLVGEAFKQLFEA